MFRVTPWNHYKPANQEQEPDVQVTTDHIVQASDMDEDVDMEAPQISILQDDKTPPPSERTSKFRVKLLVNDKRRDSSQASREDEPEDDEEEDELIDDDEEDAASAHNGRGGTTPKRSSRNKGRTSGVVAKRKASQPTILETTPVTTWLEVSGPDVEKVVQSADASETASVASATNTPSASATKKRAAPKGGAKARKPPAKQLKLSISAQRDDGDNISEAAYTGTAASSPVIRDTSPDMESNLDSIVPSAMSVPSVSVMTAEETLEGVAQPIYPLPTKPFPVLPPPKMPSGFAPVMALDKSGKKVRHWRVGKREIRGIGGGHWFARSWAGGRESEYAAAVAAGLTNPAPADTEKASISAKPTNTSASTKGGTKGKPKTDTAPSSRASSTVPDVPNRTTSGPSKMRTSHIAPTDGELVETI